MLELRVMRFSFIMKPNSYVGLVANILSIIFTNGTKESKLATISKENKKAR